MITNVHLYIENNINIIKVTNMKYYFHHMFERCNNSFTKPLVINLITTIIDSYVKLLFRFNQKIIH